jgi:FMN phosphatase YigB (HAD superfamily)
VRRSRTIIFDLYGTLLPGGSRLQRDTISYQMADVLEVDRTKFADVVRDTFDKRIWGTMGRRIGERNEGLGRHHRRPSRVPRVKRLPDLTRTMITLSLRRRSLLDSNYT